MVNEFKLTVVHCVRVDLPLDKKTGKSGLGHRAAGPPGRRAAGPSRAVGRGPAFSKTLLFFGICHKLMKELAPDPLEVLSKATISSS